MYSASGKALIAEDVALLKRLQLANAMATDGSPPTPYRIGHGGLSRCLRAFGGPFI